MQDVTQHVKGVPGGVDSESSAGLIQTIRPEQQKFKRIIRATAPEFWPFEKSIANGRLPPASFLRSEEGHEYEEPYFGRDGLLPKICIDEVYERIQR